VAHTNHPQCLDRSRELLLPALEAASASLAPEVRRIVEYHWGWVDAEGRATQAPAGKAVRPALVFLCAEAVGARAEAALAGAAAVEITHDFTLLHDDVMDGDRERRHRPAAWTVFGTGAAICAGDALMLLAQQLLLHDANERGAEAAAVLTEATQRVIAGQTLDLAYEGDLTIKPADYLRMAAGKTGALLGGAASLGGVLGGGSPEAVAALREFGESLGIAFQAADDWLGIWGQTEHTGKPVANDLRRRKASLPVVLALSSGLPESRALRDWWATPGSAQDSAVDDTADVSEAVAWIEATGAEDGVRLLAHDELERARSALDRVAAPKSTRDELLELADFVADRRW